MEFAESKFIQDDVLTHNNRTGMQKKLMQCFEQRYKCTLSGLFKAFAMACFLWFM